MNAKQKLLLFAVLAGAGTSGAIAQDEMPSPSIRPIEIYACNYNPGQGMADLMRATARWNAWMDKENRNDYWAFILVPNYRSTDIDFDVAWVGGWKDGATMAADNEFWMTKGEAMQAEFNKAVTCKAHSNFAVLDVKLSPDPWQVGPVAFSNCTIKEGRTDSEGLDAVYKWVAYESEHGIDAGQYILFPAYGESSEAKYTFKWVTLSSYQAFGKSYDQYGNGGGWQKAGELFGRVMDCDSARVYHGFPVRKVEIEQGGGGR